MKLIVVLLLVMLVLAVVIEGNITQKPETGQATTRSIEPDKASAIQSTLASLLIDSGVRVEAAVPEVHSHNYKELHVRWQSAGAGGQSKLVKQPLAGSLTVLAAVRKEGTLPRARSFELSTNQILTVAVDAQKNLRWWQLLLDPRLVRAETPNDAGELHSEEYYQTNVDFMIALPSDPAIKEVRFYQPHWTGKDFQLELLSALPLE
jgi:hypothetical protein